MNIAEPPKMGLTRQELARYLGVSLMTIRRLIARGEIGHVKVGRRGILISPEQIAEYVRRRTVARLP